jgi:hypothetical protein
VTHFDTTKVYSDRFLTLQKFILTHFDTTKVCTDAFWHYKVYSDRFLTLQKFANKTLTPSQITHISWKTPQIYPSLDSTPQKGDPMMMSHIWSTHRWIFRPIWGDKYHKRLQKSLQITHISQKTPQIYPPWTLLPKRAILRWSPISQAPTQEFTDRSEVKNLNFHIVDTYLHASRKLGTTRPNKGVFHTHGRK